MTAEILISVIVPTRDRLDDLRVCLDAIGRQVGASVEVIVVDSGAASDESKTISDLLATLPFPGRVVRIGEGMATPPGPSAARNAGVRVARGRYVAFCDDDDIWVADDHIAVFTRLLTEAPTVDYFFANQIGVREGKTEIADWLCGILPGRPLGGSLKDAADLQAVSADAVLCMKGFPHLNTTIVSRVLFERLGGFDETLRYCEDYQLAKRLAVNADLIVVRRDIVAQHNIPNRTRRDNASTRLNELERRLTLMAIDVGLLCGNRHEVLDRHIKPSLGFDFKNAMLALGPDADPVQIRLLARLALAADPSLKWAVVTVGLHLPFVGPKIQATFLRKGR